MQKAGIKFKPKPGGLASEFLFCWGCPVDMVPIMPSTDSTDSDNREQETFSPSDSPPSKLDSPWNGPPQNGFTGSATHQEMCTGLKEEDLPCRGRIREMEWTWARSMGQFIFKDQSVNPGCKHVWKKLFGKHWAGRKL